MSSATPLPASAGLRPAPAGEDGFATLAADLELGLETFTAAVLADRDEPWLSEFSPVREEIGAQVRAGLAEQLRNFSHSSLPQGCPESTAAVARTVATSEGNIDLLLGIHRSSHMVLWRAWFDLLETADLDPPVHSELLRRGSDFFFRQAELLAGFAIEAYRREAAQVGRSTEQRRFRAIRALLDGDTLLASTLDLDLDRHHLGLVVWGPQPGEAARRLATALGRPLLAVTPLEREEVCWAWISGTRELGPVEAATLEGFDPGRAGIALGLEGFGEEGFRASHRQALRARRVAASTGSALLRFEQVIVEALAGENEEDARAFVAHELRGIDDESVASRRIRETLAAYFASESNAASAGAALGVHQQTVANRLRTAEQRLGHRSIGTRRVEIEMALRLRACLAPSGAPSVGSIS